MTDPGTRNVQSAVTSQTLDIFGNATQAKIYAFNNRSTPVKIYNSTYLTDAGYLANYIRNRLLTATLTAGSTSVTLAQNYYDGKVFGSQPAYPAVVGTYSCSPSPWLQPRSTVTPANTYDSSVPISFLSRGLMSVSVNPAVTTCMWYHSYGAMALTAGSDGSTATASADAATNYAAPQTISTQSYSETIGYNAWLGITQTTGLNGEQLAMTYDTYGRPASGTSPYGTVTRYSYSNPGTVPATQTVTGPDGTTVTTLDGLGRTVRVVHNQSAVDTLYTPCGCSPLGKIWKVSAPYVAGQSAANWTVYSYDGIGRTLSVTQPDGTSTTAYVYSGNQTTVTDPAGKWKKFTNDVEGNLITVVEPDPSSNSGGTLTTTYTYDWMNHLVGVSMPRGSTTQTRTFVYDGSGGLTSATNPENGTVTYTYNADNTLQYKHDAKGQDAVYTYDTQKRVTMIQRYANGRTGAEDICQRVTYGYDTNSVTSGFSQYSMGRLTTAQYSVCAAGTLAGSGAHAAAPGGAVTEMYSYHPAGAVTAKRFQVGRSGVDIDGNYGYGSGSVEADYSYNAAGQVSTYGVAYPSTSNGGPAATYTYSFDSLSRPVSLTNGTYSQVQNVQYDFAGRMTSLQSFLNAYYGTANYLTETTGYNVNSQITSINWSSPTGLSGGLQYGYPAQNNGQISQVVDSLSGETVTYQYDALKRLTSANSTISWAQTYQYDGFGNLTAKVLNGNTTAIPVNAATNRLSNSSYDGNGNMTSGVGASFTYDEANRLMSSQPTSGGTEYYGYAPDNKRVYRLRADGVEEWTFYGARGEKLMADMQLGGPYDSYDSQGRPLYVWSYQFQGGRNFVWFGGKLISEGGSAVYSDRLGTNRASGARFYPYGEEITSTANDRVKFATYTRDAFTGLDYAYKRMYASGYGRFNTPDPYMASARSANNPAAPRSWNHYAYVQGDPVNSFDPMGLMPCPPNSENNCVEVTASSDVVPYDYSPTQVSQVSSLAEYDDVHPNIPLQKTHQRLCDAAPDGRTIGLNGALGVLGGVAVSAEVVFDYHTGGATLVFSGGFGPSGAVGQIGVTSGFIFGNDDSVPNYASGGNTTIAASLPSGLGVLVTANSGGLTGNPLQIDPTSATAIQLSYSAGLVSLLGGFSATAQNTIQQISLGSFLNGPASVLATPFDTLLTAFQSGCN